MKLDYLLGLDLAQLREMLEKNGKKEELDKLIREVLDAVAEHKIHTRCFEKVCGFLNGLTISDEILNEFQFDEFVSLILMKSDCSPKDKIKNLVLNNCNIKTLCALVEEGKISVKELEDWLVKENKLDYNFYAIFNVSGLDLDRLESETDGLFNEIMETAFLKIKEYFIKGSHSDYCLKFAEVLCRNKRMDRIIQILNHYFNSAVLNPLEIPSILLLYKFYLKELKAGYKLKIKYDDDDFYDLQKALERFKKEVSHNLGNQYKKVALMFELLNLEYYVPSIINNWVSNDSILEYEIYGEYLLGDNKDYENIGSKLDARYMQELEKQQDEKIPFPGLKA